MWLLGVKVTLSAAWGKDEIEWQVLNVELQERQWVETQGWDTGWDKQPRWSANANALASLCRLPGKLSERTEVCGLRNAHYYPSFCL